MVLLVLLAAAIGASGCASAWKGSVGAVLGKDNRTGRVYVRDVPKDMGAAKAGIQVDDELIAIDGTAVTGMSPAEVHAALAGTVGSKVTLSVSRGGEPVTAVVERGPLRVDGADAGPEKR